MAAPTVAEFRAQFPTAFLALTHPDALITTRIGEASQIHGVRKLATIYLVAHLLAVDGEATGAPDGGAGVVSSETIGPRKVAYLTMAGGRDAEPGVLRDDQLRPALHGAGRVEPARGYRGAGGLERLNRDQCT